MRSPSVTQGFLRDLEQAVDRNIESYADVCEMARSPALQWLAQHAEELGADAVIGMRYDATDFSRGATEVPAYGTAVKSTRDR